MTIQTFVYIWFEFILQIMCMVSINDAKRIHFVPKKKRNIWLVTFLCVELYWGTVLCINRMVWLLKSRINAAFLLTNITAKFLQVLEYDCNDRKRMQTQNNFQSYLQAKLFTWRLENHAWNVLPMMTLKSCLRRISLFFVETNMWLW